MIDLGAAIKAKIKNEADGTSFVHLRSLMSEYLKYSSGTAAYSFLDRTVIRASERMKLPDRRVSLLASFTIDPLIPFLRVHLFLHGYSAQFQVIGYQQWPGELAQKSSIDIFAPTDVLMFLHSDDALPCLAKSFLSSSSEMRSGEAESLLAVMRQSVLAFRSRSEAQIFISTLPLLVNGPERYLAASTNRGRLQELADFNVRISTEFSKLSGVYIYPYDELVQDAGRSGFFDQVKNNLNQTAISSNGYPILAKDLSRFLRNTWDPRIKAIVLDLDNTVWGGVIGEDGIDGIELGTEGRGKAFRDLQLFLKELHSTGVLLAVCSKNNLSDAKEVFEKHPSSILKWSDFSAARINWIDKATNISEIATELNIGLSSMVFVDDNRMECEHVKSVLPEINVMNFDGMPELLPQRLLDFVPLEPIKLSTDDLQRNSAYAAERVRREAQVQFANYDEFLKSLELKLKIFKASARDLPRLAQLAGKTNQFNTTTIRWSEQQLANMLEDSSYEVLSFSLSDRLGDYGTIGMVVLREQESALHIDTYLMSCRILGRRVEDAILFDIQQRALRRSLDKVVGYYRPSLKNIQVSDLYHRFGFKSLGSATITSRHFSLDSAECFVRQMSDGPWMLPSTIELGAN